MRQMLTSDSQELLMLGRCCKTKERTDGKPQSGQLVIFSSFCVLLCSFSRVCLPERLNHKTKSVVLLKLSNKSKYPLPNNVQIPVTIVTHFELLAVWTSVNKNATASLCFGLNKSNCECDHTLKVLQSTLVACVGLKSRICSQQSFDSTCYSCVTQHMLFFF